MFQKVTNAQERDAIEIYNIKVDRNHARISCKVAMISEKTYSAISPNFVRK